jgi:protein-tyrosine phosphatase
MTDILQAPPINKPIKCLLPGRFLLAHRPQDDSSASNIYTFQDLKRAFPTVAGVLDLQRAPRRWYDKDVKYKRIVLPGGPEAAPSKRKLWQCLRFIDAFKKEHPTKLLYVHCRHGINRTGLVCALYLKRKGVENPLDLFLRQRGATDIRPHIQSLVNDFDVFYHPTK